MGMMDRERKEIDFRKLSRKNIKLNMHVCPVVSDIDFSVSNYQDFAG